MTINISDFVLRNHALPLNGGNEIVFPADAWMSYTVDGFKVIGFTNSRKSVVIVYILNGTPIIRDTKRMSFSADNNIYITINGNKYRVGQWEALS